MKNGSVVIAAITSCTNTSNPSVMLGAGLMAQKAVKAGLSVQPFVKTSLSPGSGVVTYYLRESGVLPFLEKLGLETSLSSFIPIIIHSINLCSNAPFHKERCRLFRLFTDFVEFCFTVGIANLFNFHRFDVVGYGCMSCIGNSGPLEESIVTAIEKNNLVCCGVLSGNRNFEGRIHPNTRANYLASPLLVIAYAIAGTVNIDFDKEPIAYNDEGRAVYLSEIWPSRQEIHEVEQKYVIPAMFREVYEKIEVGSPAWQSLQAPVGQLYPWDEQ